MRRKALRWLGPKEAVLLYSTYKLSGAFVLLSRYVKIGLFDDLRNFTTDDECLAYVEFQGQMKSHEIKRNNPV